MVKDYRIIIRNFLLVQIVCEKLFKLIINQINFKLLTIPCEKHSLEKFIKIYEKKFNINFKINVIENRLNEDYDYN